jgi:surface protein
MATILEILTTNYDGQIADITFYPCSGGSIRIGNVTLPYDYETEDYYGTYDIYLPNYNKTCSLNIPCPPPTEFISVWRTTGAIETVTLPYLASGSIYSGLIDWGDGTTSVNSYANRIHTYTGAGDYTITIDGFVSGFCFNNAGDKLKLREIKHWGNKFSPNNNYGTFFGCTNLVLTGVTGEPDLTSMSALTTFFYACPSLTTIANINNWDTSNIKSLNRMFENSTNFNDNVGGWNTSNVIDMQNVFANARNFNNGGSPDINNWNTSGVTTMRYLFGSDSSGVYHNFNQPIGNWDTSKVVTMELMFSKGAFNQDIGNWNLSSCQSLYGTFFDATSFNQNIGSWNTSGVTTMAYLFNCSRGDGVFNNGGSNSINNWNTSKVITMLQMFVGQPYFNQPIGSWNTSGVTRMDFMFYAYTSPRLPMAFNQDISGWNTSNVTSMTGMFVRASSFNQPLNSWNTVKVTNMSDMFFNAYAFNQPIGNWVVSGVTTFGTSGGFMSGKTYNDYSTTNYDNLLIGWASRPVLANKIINFGTIKHTSGATASKAILTSPPNSWTITDGGLI